MTYLIETLCDADLKYVNEKSTSDSALTDTIIPFHRLPGPYLLQGVGQDQYEEAGEHIPLLRPGSECCQATAQSSETAPSPKPQRVRLLLRGG